MSLSRRPLRARTTLHQGSRRHTTAGFEVNVKHFGATPKGKKVTVRAELLEVDGRKLRFKVEAHDEDKKVGEGTHRRAIVQIQRKA